MSDGHCHRSSIDRLFSGLWARDSRICRRRSAELSSCPGEFPRYIWEAERVEGPRRISSITFRRFASAQTGRLLSSVSFSCALLPLILSISLSIQDPQQYLKSEPATTLGAIDIVLTCQHKAAIPMDNV
jgi:hypothetical protein